MWGSIHPHKNQIAAMEAFNLVRARRPDLDIWLHQFGTVQSRMVAQVGRLVRQSGERLKTHGFVDDKGMAETISRCRASIFVSLAEGYGLPLAESLWVGKPCLTSNVEPMTEIAAGGGCLLVDPTDVEKIAGGLETLASEPAVAARLRGEIAKREFRTWRDYASEFVGSIQEREEDLNEAGGDGIVSYNRRDQRPIAALIETIVFSAKNMAIHPVYRRAAPPVISDDRFRFLFSQHGQIEEQTLCYGPYATLEAGCYECCLNGTVSGSVVVMVTSLSGQIRHVESRVSDFRTRLLFRLAEKTERVEILLTRTLNTITVEFDSIQLDRYALNAA
jgi:hypothetical protein